MLSRKPSVLVFPGGTPNDPGIFGSLLEIEIHAVLGTGLHAATKVGTQEGKEEFRIGDAHLATQLGVAVVDESAQIARQTLVSPPHLGREGLGTLEDIAVFVGSPYGKAQVALRVGSFQFERNRLRLVLAQQDVAIEQILAPLILPGRFKTNVDILDNAQAAESGIGIVDVATAVQKPRPYETVLDQRLAADIGVLPFDEIVVLVHAGVGDIDAVGRSGIVGEYKIDVVHVIAFIGTITLGVDQRVGPDGQGQVHRLGTVGRIGSVGNQLLVEGIETVPP